MERFQSTLYAQATSQGTRYLLGLQNYFNPRSTRKRHRNNIGWWHIRAYFNPRSTRKRHPHRSEHWWTASSFQSTLYAQATSANMHNLLLPSLYHSPKFYPFFSLNATQIKKSSNLSPKIPTFLGANLPVNLCLLHIRTFLTNPSFSPYIVLHLHPLFKQQ